VQATSTDPYFAGTSGAALVAQTCLDDYCAIGPTQVGLDLVAADGSHYYDGPISLTIF